jgi:hypothetical protein
MTPQSLDRFREAARRAQLVALDDGLKLETMERIMPLLREYLELRKKLSDIWVQEEEIVIQLQALSSWDIGGNELRADAQAVRRQGDEAARAVRRLHSFIMRTPMNALGKEPAAHNALARVMACNACSRGLYYLGSPCLVCAAAHCITCGEAIASGRQHACDESVASTFREVVCTTQTCPSCHVMISRTEGCDQMWCTRCETPFSYRTGERVVDGPIHNPHFLDLPEEQRTRIRRLLVQGGDACGDVEMALVKMAAPEEVTRAWYFLGHVRETLPEDQVWLETQHTPAEGEKLIDVPPARLQENMDHFDFELSNRMQRLAAISGHRVPPPPVRGRPPCALVPYRDSERVAHLLLVDTKLHRRQSFVKLHTDFEDVMGDLFGAIASAQSKEAITLVGGIWETFIEKSAAFGDFKNSVVKWRA